MGLRKLLAPGLFALALVACAGASQDETQSRTPNPSIPREGLGAGGDTGPAARDMPGKGRGSESPKGKP